MRGERKEGRVERDEREGGEGEIETRKGDKERSGREVQSEKSCRVPCSFREVTRSKVSAFLLI